MFKRIFTHSNNINIVVARVGVYSHLLLHVIFMPFVRVSLVQHGWPPRRHHVMCLGKNAIVSACGVQQSDGADDVGIMSRPLRIPRLNCNKM